MLAAGALNREDERVSVRSVLLVVHPDRPAAAALAKSAREWWERREVRVIELGRIDDPGYSAPDEFDLAVSLGGDGTMLRTVDVAFRAGVPIVGVNLGRMGYLTRVEPSNMEVAFALVAAGQYRVEDRMALEVEVRFADPATAPLSYHALNEAIVERESHGHTIRVGVSIGGETFLTYIADGLLVCTPTGSTAYNLSARGPIVSPFMRAMVLTPIAPHLGFDRSLVLEADEEVALTMLDERRAALVLDGVGCTTLHEGDSVACRGAAQPARFVTFEERDFLAVLRSRFRLADR
jgi:NAD+ kinase